MAFSMDDVNESREPIEKCSESERAVKVIRMWTHCG